VRVLPLLSSALTTPRLPAQGKSEDEPSLPPALQAARARATGIARQLGHVQRDFGLSVDPEEYANEHLNFGLMEVRVCWCLAGKAFF
jgi:hypothetical protein